MLESAEIGHAIAKAAYAREEPRLREALLNAQFDLSQNGRGPVLIVISGVDGGGRGETANKLTEWMDPRHIHVFAFGERTPRKRRTRRHGAIGARCRRAAGSASSCNAWYNELDACARARAASTTIALRGRTCRRSASTSRC